MTTTIQCNQREVSLLFTPNTFFTEKVQLRDYQHMQELLGGDCFAIQLPESILVWCSFQKDRKPYEHSISIASGGYIEVLLGNVVITSNDDDNMNGFRDLSDRQMKWLAQNSQLIKSELNDYFIIQFNVN